MAHTAVFVGASGVVVVDTKNPGWGQPILDKITVSYRPMRDGKNGGMFISGTTAAGKLLTMGGAGDGEPAR